MLEDVGLGTLQLAWQLLIAVIECFGKLWRWALAPTVTRFKRNIAGAWRASRAGSWPLTDGAVEQIYDEEHFTEWRIEIAYSYQIEGERYSGYVAYPFGRDADSERLRSLLPEGGPLTIRYDYLHKDRSLILISDQRCLAGHHI